MCNGPLIIPAGRYFARSTRVECTVHDLAGQSYAGRRLISPDIRLKVALQLRTVRTRRERVPLVRELCHCSTVRFGKEIEIPIREV